MVDHVLRNTNGKILRRVLAEQFQQQEVAKSEAEIEEAVLKGKLAVEPRLEQEDRTAVAALSDKGRMWSAVVEPCELKKWRIIQENIRGGVQTVTSSLNILLKNAVFRIRIPRIQMFLGLPDPHLNSLVKIIDPDPAPDPSLFS